MKLLLVLVIKKNNLTIPKNTHEKDILVRRLEYRKWSIIVFVFNTIQKAKLSTAVVQQKILL